MGLSVAQFLKKEELTQLKLIAGEQGINKEITGTTIIEIPDVVRYINGGELLLTALYAFNSCDRDSYISYIAELKDVSGIVLKNGRSVQNVDEKRELLREFCQENAIPLMEMPQEMQYQKVMTLVMESLFNEEVTRLKYDKNTRDNFMAMTVSDEPQEAHIDNILSTLEKLIGNPAALYSRSGRRIAGSDRMAETFVPDKKARKYDPGIYTRYEYLVQKTDRCRYIVCLKLSVGSSMYLVVEETDSEFDLMNCIAVENAIISLQFEFSRAFAVAELEKKFQNDILFNLLQGHELSREELVKNAALLDVPPEGYFRVLVFGVAEDIWNRKNIDTRLQYLSVLEDALRELLTNGKLRRENDRIILVRNEEDCSQSEYRQQLKELLHKVQTEAGRRCPGIRLKVGAGKLVKGLVRIHETCQEANDAYLFADIAGDSVGDVVGEDKARMVLFSDLGIFKLLCQIDDPDMLMEYVPESLQKLYAYRKPQRDDLIDTLKMYLDHNQNLSKAAQDLFIHYKTAAYRMEKIEKITGIDFTNANEILSVRIGLVVYQMIEKYKLRK